jgi:pilus assembly protein CpaF
MDDSVSEIMINGPSDVFIERKGLIEKTDAKFEDEGALQAAVRNISQYVKRPIDEDHLTMDARLPDGSRIHAVIPPCARNGTTVSIRKFSRSKMVIKDLVDRGSISMDGARFLDVCLYLKKNMLVSGGTGSGKTTLLGVLAARIPQNQRIIVIEDSSELQINLQHVVFFETKAPNVNGKGEVTMRDLIKSSLRLRPDRIIVGEVRGGEAYELLQAMNTGHSGSMGTVHANNPKESLVRLESLCLMSGLEISIQALRAQVASAINIVVQTSRFVDGSRKISHITECLGMDDVGRYITNDIFVFKQTGRDENGKVIGSMVPTGNMPSFVEEIITNNLPFDAGIFANAKNKTAA